MRGYARALSLSLSVASAVFRGAGDLAACCGLLRRVEVTAVDSWAVSCPASPRRNDRSHRSSSSARGLDDIEGCEWAAV